MGFYVRWKALLAVICMAVVSYESAFVLHRLYVFACFTQALVNRVTGVSLSGVVCRYWNTVTRQRFEMRFYAEGHNEFIGSGGCNHAIRTNTHTHLRLVVCLFGVALCVLFGGSGLGPKTAFMTCTLLATARDEQM